MLKIVLIFLCLYSILLFVKKKYSNPYSLTFCFGKKGSGKTTFLIHELIKHHKKGYTCYANFDCNLPYVRIFQPEDLRDFKPEQNSFVVVDEISLVWRNRDFKAFDKKITEYFKLQRHFKCKMLVASQTWGDSDKFIRDLSDSLILQTNILNIISVGRPIIRRITLTEASSEGESRVADQLQFAKIWNWHFYFMPRYYKYFDSHAVPDRELIPFRDNSACGPVQDNKNANRMLKLLNRKNSHRHSDLSS